MCRVLTSQQRTPSNLRLVSPASASPFLPSRPPRCRCDPVDTSKKGPHSGLTACHPTTPSSPRHTPLGTLLGSVLGLEKGPFKKERRPSDLHRPPPRVGCGSHVSPGTKWTLKAQRGWLLRADPFLNISTNRGPSTHQLDPGRPTGVGHHVGLHFDTSVVVTAAAIHTEVFLGATTNILRLWDLVP